MVCVVGVVGGVVVVVGVVSVGCSDGEKMGWLELELELGWKGLGLKLDLNNGLKEEKMEEVGRRTRTRTG